jgi:hypothetical protein
MPSERRHSPRIEILGKLHGHTVAFDVPVLVREISLGGMAVETQIPLVQGSVHEFLLTLGDGSTVELVGRIMHSRLMSQEGDPSYVSGVQFVDEQPADGFSTNSASPYVPLN